MNNYLGLLFMGGLGNQLFQLAALHSVSRKSGRIPFLSNVEFKSPHTDHTYFNTIFKKWKLIYKSIVGRTVMEPSHLFHDWSHTLQSPETIILEGYFQDYRYIDPEFATTLRFSTECLERHPTISSMVFLHLRGGDYIGNTSHELDLDGYYRRATSMFPGAHFAIFTNDMVYAKNRRWLTNLPHTFITESEEDSLFLMSKCAGGICANSTFSWWGAYLNRNRTLVLPDTWTPTGHFRTEGLYFPEAVVCQVSEGFPAYCIHLAHRTDRREHMDALAAKYPSLRIEFIDAIPHSNGAIGGNLSHKKAIREAKARGDPYVLVLEDDCEMLVDNATLVRFLAIIRDYIQTHPEVEIINGCGNLPTLSHPTMIVPFKDMHFLSSHTVYTAHFILYCARSYDKILASSSDVPADVVTNDCAMVFTYPYLATQIPSYSDILKVDVSYDNIEASRRFIGRLLTPAPPPRTPDPLTFLNIR